MRKILSVLAFLLIPTLLAMAQKVKPVPDTDGGEQISKAEQIRIIRQKGIKDRMAYCDYKDLYDSRQYVRMPGDPYSPLGAGIASFFIPGLGQIINDQVGKGIGMILGETALVAGSIAFACLCVDDRKTTPLGTAGFFICLSGALAVNVWAICDAVHVAKIKNLYFRDCSMLSGLYDVKLLPSLAFTQTPQGTQAAPGMTLAIRF